MIPKTDSRESNHFIISHYLIIHYSYEAHDDPILLLLLDLITCFVSAVAMDYILIEQCGRMNTIILVIDYQFTLYILLNMYENGFNQSDNTRIIVLKESN